MARVLNEGEMVELKNWLGKKSIPVNNLHRICSDGVAVAQLIKKIHPKLIDLNNYPSCSSTALKIKNWETLNYKILDKLKLHQNGKAVENIVKCVPGALEYFLYRLMRHEKLHLSKLTKDEQEQIWLENEEIMFATVQQKKDDPTSKVSEKFIMYSIYEQVMKDTDSIEKLIKANEYKLCHLRKLLTLKEERITELKRQLEKQKIQHRSK